jgi:hypothetical protein
MQATANAFVMLGLISEELTEAVLAHCKESLVSRGFDPGDLTIRSGSAHLYWSARTHAQETLVAIPSRFSAASTHCADPVADVHIYWFWLTPSDLRINVSILARSSEHQHQDLLDLLNGLSLVDSSGRVHDVGFESEMASRGVWNGELFTTGEEFPRDIPWFTIHSEHGNQTDRIVFPVPPPISIGTCPHPWASPAECYVAWLVPEFDDPVSGRGNLTLRERDEVLAATVDSLLTVGALPSDSQVLAPHFEHRPESWQRPLMARWCRRLPPHVTSARVGLNALLPFENATCILEGVSTRDGVVDLRLYGSPWGTGEYWPLTVPSFRLTAISDLGSDHRGMLLSESRCGATEASANFRLWPPVDTKVDYLRIVVSTLWESAWAEINLPRGQGERIPGSGGPSNRRYCS